MKGYSWGDEFKDDGIVPVPPLPAVPVPANLLDYKIIRDDHPTLTLYWISQSVTRGRPVMLSEVSCMFCKRTLFTEFKGEIINVINAPVSTDDYGMALTVRCKQCKQNYRLVAVESYLR